MPNTELTWSEANKAWAKSLGHWFDESGDRVRRFFRFAYPKTPEGQRQAQHALIPIIAEWLTVKAEAKKMGIKHPAWYRPSLEVATMDPFKMAPATPPPEVPEDARLSDDEKRALKAQAAKDRKAEENARAYRKSVEASRVNQQANP